MRVWEKTPEKPQPADTNHTTMTLCHSPHEIRRLPRFKFAVSTLLLPDIFFQGKEKYKLSCVSERSERGSNGAQEHNRCYTVTRT